MYLPLPHFRTTARAALAAAVIAVLGACGDATRPAGEAGELHMVNGDGQRGVVASELPDMLVVRLVDRSGTPVSGASVAWKVLDGGGTIAPATSTTGSDGRASATWRLGTTTTSQRVSAEVQGGVATGFDAIALPDVPATLRHLRGDGEPAPAGEPIPGGAAVMVEDRFGNLVPEAAVEWAVSAGGGSVNSPVSLSGADGVARTGWTLGSALGENRLLAAHSGIEVAELRMIARPGAPAGIRLLSDSLLVASRTGPFPEPVRVETRDRFGHPVPGVAFSWDILAGGGQVLAPSLSDSSGRASAAWSLGAVVDGQRLRVSAGNASVYVRASVTAAGAGVSHAEVTLRPGTAAHITVTAHDAAGTSLSAEGIEWSSSDSSVAIMRAGGRALALSDGEALLQAKVGEWSAATRVRVAPVTALVTGRAQELDLASAPAVRATLRTVSGTFSADADSLGRFTIGANVQLGDTVEIILTDGSDPGGRLSSRVRPGSQSTTSKLPAGVHYHPSYMRVASHTLPREVRMFMVPRYWTVETGTYAGRSIPLSMASAFRPPCNNPVDTNCDGFYPRSWFFGIKLWRSDALPVPVAFDRIRTTAAISAADSIALWEILDRMNADYGQQLFRPAVLDDFIVNAEGRGSNVILVRIDSSLQGVGGWTNWWWNARDELTSATVRVRNLNLLRDPGLMSHELLHALGFKHSCSWSTVMGGYGCPNASGLSAEDVAHAHMVTQLRDAQFRTSRWFGLVEALQGERVITLGMQQYAPFPGMAAMLMLPDSDGLFMDQAGHYLVDERPVGAKISPL